MTEHQRCRRIIRECEQLIRDVEWWNRNRPDAPPLDCEIERVLLPLARRCLAALKVGSRAEAGKLFAEMARVGAAGIASD